MNVSKKIGSLITSTNFQIKVQEIQKLAEEDLKTAIIDIIYSQPESSWYKRTYSLLHSIKSTDLKVTPTSISFKVIFDEDILKHYSLFGSEKYGLEEGESVGGLIVPWLNEGWKWNSYSGGLVDNFMYRKPEKFIEEAIEKIREDTIRRIQNLISIEIRKIGFTK